MRREFAHVDPGGKFLDDVPDQLFRHGFAPDSARAAYPSKEAAQLNVGSRDPGNQETMHVIRLETNLGPGCRSLGDNALSAVTGSHVNSWISRPEK
jgi:hypothetical protein